MGEGLAEEEIRHEHLVLVGGVGVGEDVGALEGLVAETEDVVDDEDGGGGVGGTGGVCEVGLVVRRGGGEGWRGETNNISCHR